MAIRPYYYVENGLVKKRNIEFKWYPGFAMCQKRKCIDSLHNAIGEPTLEISTKSQVNLGQNLSAFRVLYNGYTVENVYQAGKKFSSGGPYGQLLDLTPKDAKRSNLLKESGDLEGYFDWTTGENWKLEEPFYDYIYVQAVRNALTQAEVEEFVSYEGYTDIEFNPSKGTNTQAKAAAIAKLMFISNIELLNSINKNEFICFYRSYVMV